MEMGDIFLHYILDLGIIPRIDAISATKCYAVCVSLPAHSSIPGSTAGGYVPTYPNDVMLRCLITMNTNNASELAGGNKNTT